MNLISIVFWPLGCMFRGQLMEKQVVVVLFSFFVFLKMSLCETHQIIKYPNVPPDHLKCLNIRISAILLKSIIS